MNPSPKASVSHSDQHNSPFRPKDPDFQNHDNDDDDENSDGDNDKDNECSDFDVEGVRVSPPIIRLRGSYPPSGDDADADD